MSESHSAAISPEAIAEYITTTFDDVQVIRSPSGRSTFFSRDPAHFPNFATIVTDDENDEFSDLSNRPDVYRLNIGVGRATFESLVTPGAEHDYTALDVLMAHPVYAKQLFLCILNPSRETFEDTLKPLLAEAYERVATQYRKRNPTQGL